MLEERSVTYDPMVYDLLHEAASRLKGAYVTLSDRAVSPGEKQAWREKYWAVDDEMRSVNARSKREVEEKTREFLQRKMALVGYESVVG